MYRMLKQIIKYTKIPQKCNFTKLLQTTHGCEPGLEPTTFCWRGHHGFKVVVKINYKFYNIFAALEYYEMLEIYGEFGDVPGNLIINWGNLSGVIFKGLITLRWPANDAPASVIQF